MDGISIVEVMADVAQVIMFGWQVFKAIKKSSKNPNQNTSESITDAEQKQ